MKEGITKFVNKGLYATLEKVKQLHDRTCFRPIHLNKFTSQELKQAMELLIFLMEKCDEIIKG